MIERWLPQPPTGARPDAAGCRELEGRVSARAGDLTRQGLLMQTEGISEYEASRSWKAAPPTERAHAAGNGERRLEELEERPE